MRSRVLSALLAATLVWGVTACSDGYDGLADLPVPGGEDVGRDPLVVTVEFGDALNLSRRATVKVDDVTVGRVESIRRVGWHAEVELLVRSDTALPANAVAALRQTGLLGEKYVELFAPVDEPPAGKLVDGARIALDRTTRSFEVEEVLSSLSLLLNGGGLENLRTITMELHDALGGREPQVRALLRRVDTFTGTLADSRREINAALDGVDKLSARAAAGAEVIERALSRLPLAVDALADQRQELTAMLTSLSRLGAVSARTIRAAQADLVGSLRALEPVLAHLAEAGDDIPRSLEFLLTYPFPDSAMDAVRGDYVNFAASYTLRPEDLLVLLGARSAGAGGQHRLLGGREAP